MKPPRKKFPTIGWFAHWRLHRRLRKDPCCGWCMFCHRSFRSKKAVHAKGPCDKR